MDTTLRKTIIGCGRFKGTPMDLGLAPYAAAFRDNEIDGAVLPKLTVDDLKDLGVAVVGH